MRIRLVPDERVTFSVLCFFFDVENERSGASQNALKLRGTRQKPVDVLIRLHATICLRSTIRIRRRRYNQLERLVVESVQDLDAIAAKDFRLYERHKTFIIARSQFVDGSGCNRIFDKVSLLSSASEARAACLIAEQRSRLLSSVHDQTAVEPDVHRAAEANM